MISLNPFGDCLEADEYYNFGKLIYTALREILLFAVFVFVSSILQGIGDDSEEDEERCSSSINVNFSEFELLHLHFPTELYRRKNELDVRSSKVPKDESSEDFSNNFESNDQKREQPVNATVATS